VKHLLTVAFSAIAAAALFAAAPPVKAPTPRPAAAPVAEADLTTVTYKVADVMARIPDCEEFGAESKSAALARIVTLVVRSVGYNRGVAAWKDDKGPAEVQVLGDAMVVRQTARGHVMVADLLARLRRVLAAPAAPLPPEPAEIAAVRGRLGRKITAKFDSAGLPNVLDLIGQAANGLKITCDPSIEEQGVDLKTRPVTLKVKDAPAETVLHFVLMPDLTYRIQSDGVLVTSRESVGLALEVYPVANIVLAAVRYYRADTGAPNEMIAISRPSEPLQQFLELVRRTVSVGADPETAAWTDEGGPAVLEYLAGALVVTQTPRGQERVAAMLAQLRQALAAAAQGKGARPQVAGIGGPSTPDATAVATALAAKVEVHFKDTLLNQALDFLAELKPGLNVLVEREAVGNAGIDLAERKTSLDAKQATRESVLSKMLGKELGYRIEPGCIVVTSRERAIYPLALVMYPVADLRRGTDEKAWADAFADALERAVNGKADANTAAWSTEGGPAMCECFASVLLVTQTSQGHQKVAQFVAGLRRR